MLRTCWPSESNVTKALLAILASAGVRYEAWLKHTLPLYLGLLALGLVAIAVAVGVGLGL